MSIMIEIYYAKPANLTLENSIRSTIAAHGGEITYRETDSDNSICLTAEFASWEKAQAASSTLREAGEYVEGPVDYGDS